MPLRSLLQDGILYTYVSGILTDQELFEHYSHLSDRPRDPWLELVDGSEIRTMQLTPDGYRRLQELLAKKHGDALKGGRVAMLAKTDAVYGMFRMWELQREALGYAVRVFRDRDEALAWLRSG